MLQVITGRLDNNLARVRNLVSLYQAEGRGRRGTQDTDVLRAAVVLLHAGMEDYLRSLLIWKIDTFGADVLKEYRLQMAPDEWREKVTMADLHSAKGKTVEALISESVTAQIRKYQTFSTLDAVKKALKRCGINGGTVDTSDYGQLEPMIDRRHQIVHHADRNEDAQGRGNHRTNSIGRGHLNGYVAAVETLRDLVSAELGTA